MAIDAVFLLANPGGGIYEIYILAKARIWLADLYQAHLVSGASFGDPN